MDQRQTKTLARLQLLSSMKKDAELAKLATVAQSRMRLQTALNALKSTEEPLDSIEGQSARMAASMINARLAHRRWIEAQQRRLNQQLALVTADYLRQKPAAAKAFGRAAVLEQLTEQAITTQRQNRDKSQ
jgi:hypothetical protein